MSFSNNVLGPTQPLLQKANRLVVFGFFHVCRITQNRYHSDSLSKSPMTCSDEEAALSYLRIKSNLFIKIVILILHISTSDATEKPQTNVYSHRFVALSIIKAILVLSRGNQLNFFLKCSKFINILSCFFPDCEATQRTPRQNTERFRPRRLDQFSINQQYHTIGYN